MTQVRVGRLEMRQVALLGDRERSSVLAIASLSLVFLGGAMAALSISWAVIFLMTGAGICLSRVVKLPTPVPVGLVLLGATIVSLPGSPPSVLVILSLATLIFSSHSDYGPAFPATVMAVGIGVVGALTQSFVAGFADESVLGTYSRFLILGSAVVAPMARPRAGRSMQVNLLRVVVLAFTGLTALSALIPWPRVSLSNLKISGYSTTNGDIRFFGWGASPNEMGFICAILLIALVSGFVFGAFQKWFTIVCSTPLVAALLSTSARAAVITTTIGCLAVVLISLLRGRVTWGRGSTLGVIVLTGLGVALSIDFGGRDLLGRGNDGSSVYRQAITNTVWARINEGAVTIFGGGLQNGNQPRPNSLNYGDFVIDGSLYYLLGVVGLSGLIIVVCAIAISLATTLLWRLPAFALAVGLLVTLGFENAVAWPVALSLFTILGGLSNGTVVTSRL
jgi:hypothetical protein